MSGDQIMAINIGVTVFILFPLFMWLEIKNKKIAMFVYIGFVGETILFTFSPYLMIGWVYIFMSIIEDIDDDDTPGCFG